MKREFVAGFLLVFLILVGVFLVAKVSGIMPLLSPGDERSCSDSDRGLEFGVKGAVIGLYGTEYGDECKNEKVLREGYCNIDNRVRTYEKTCDGVCVEGRCVE